MSAWEDEGYAVTFLETVRDVSGEEGVRVIQDLVGGIRVRIPRSAGPDHWLARALGSEKANRVCLRLAVDDADGRVISYPPIVIPLGARALCKKAMLSAECRLLAGGAVRTVARQVGVSERTVWRLRARLVAEGLLTRAPASETGEVVDKLLLAGHPVKQAAELTGATKSNVAKRHRALMSKGMLDSAAYRTLVSKQIRGLLLAGGTPEGIAERAKCALATVNAQRQQLIAEGKLEDRS